MSISYVIFIVSHIWSRTWNIQTIFDYCLAYLTYMSVMVIWNPIAINESKTNLEMIDWSFLSTNPSAIPEKKMAQPQKKIDLIILQKTRRIRIQFLYCPQLDTSWDVTKSGRTISFVYFENNWEVLRVDECISTRYDSSNIYESGILDNVVSYKCMKKIKNRYRPTAVSFKFDFEIYVDVEFLSHGACWNSLFWFKMWKP